jgi:hypothetical protein
LGAGFASVLGFGGGMVRFVGVFGIETYISIRICRHPVGGWPYGWRSVSGCPPRWAVRFGRAARLRQRGLGDGDFGD